MQKKQTSSGQDGMITPVILIILAVFFVFATSIMNWAFQARKDVVSKARSTQALQIAEAGIDYYKWHLAHNEDDYKDGNSWCCKIDGNEITSVSGCGGVCGPYAKVYKDYDGNDVGEYSLTLTPPATGSTIVQIESKGKTYKDNNVEKTINAKLGKKSLARYSLLSDSAIWIGEDEQTSGPLHSNAGIRFDGTCDAEVTSAVATYNCNTAGHDCTGTKPGVWGSASTGCSQYWDFPEGYTDFNLFTLDMAGIQEKADDSGIYLGPSGKEGYWLVFKIDGTVDISMVETRQYNVKYYDNTGTLVTDQEGIKNYSFIGNYPIPENGLIFAQDNVWINGTVNGRATVAASKYADNPQNYARIIINGSILYEARDGSDVLGLMAEGDILVPRHVEAPLEIDAVMLSQKGHVYVRNYNSSYKKIKNGSITVYGGIISDLFWTWSYVSSNGNTVDGYTDTITQYDNNLTFGPPPSFPTEENYKILDWSEKR